MTRLRIRRGRPDQSASPSHPSRGIVLGAGPVVVLTEHDLATAVARGASPDTDVAVFAHPVTDLPVAPPGTSLMEAARLMADSHLTVEDTPAPSAAGLAVR